LSTESLLAIERNHLRSMPRRRSNALDIISKHARLAIRSGNDVGKTALLSWIAIWFALTRSEALMPWAELARWIRRLPPDIVCDIDVGADRLTVPATGSVIVARTASRDNPESLQGFHAPAGRLLFLLEEASGID
jgi:hypothetical protein